MKGHYILISFLSIAGQKISALHHQHAHQNPAVLPKELWGTEFTRKKSADELHVLRTFIQAHQQELLPATASYEQETPCKQPLSELERALLPTLQPKPGTSAQTLWNQLAQHPVIVGIYTGNLSAQDRQNLESSNLIDHKHDHKHDCLDSEEHKPIKLAGPLPSLVLLTQKNKIFLADYASFDQLRFIVNLYTKRLASLQAGQDGTILLSSQDQSLFNRLDLEIRKHLEKNYVLKHPSMLHYLRPIITLPCIALLCCYYYVSSIAI